MSEGAEYKSVAMRDLGAARKAYEAGDAEASRAAHAARVVGSPETHSKAGGHIKSVVFGGLDGIITTFAVVAGAVGGGLSVDVILILGFSSVFADALSMGVGDALSSKAENEFIMLERSREEWELENDKEGEVQEMVDLYTSKGMKEEDAREVITRMAKYPDFFVDVMMVEELELQVPDPDDNPIWDGLVTFCSFVVFGTVPLLGYVAFSSLQLTVTALFGIACFLTACTLFGLGMVKSQFTKMTWYRSGLEVLVLGSCTAMVAYFIGWFVESVTLSGGGVGGLH
uniref:Uncharacterized protein n=1 Tax=Bicosoecida sp. CB-2014 TaxID=1486930 RepID=A0A7S1CNE0_9STRA|mmetsp:Transcript_7147/g.25486  ORF Transcript_7147/g.25486 Transcript_7147/m.25486 type:complete len:285 (+) Transcript_7147:138-992(+)|eukprot:CAMPEP_0203818992 /NCGR_PEP_ID=MMETSP0115-20131106/33612_1 /ASSEMBLY_ACC=CAM_ASM_000227 /TAXON_ID=33651 /ORGANISM="Bicosoecid sp, Strain ms1" /LENGTH=284 /DNA_ID=CAMNT_0050727967 /DNA_START=133 /DNA_END=987 /DNA_ORIENTATION=-